MCCGWGVSVELCVGLYVRNVLLRFIAQELWGYDTHESFAGHTYCQRHPNSLQESLWAIVFLLEVWGNSA